MDADRVIPRKKPETSATFFVGTNSRVPRMTLAQSSHLIPMPMRSPTVRPPINRPLAQRKEMPRNQAVGEATGTHQQPALPRSTAPGGHGRVARAVEKFSQAEDETSLMADSSNLEGDQQAENTPCQSPPALHSELAELDDSRVVTMSLHHSDQPITRPVETVEPQVIGQSSPQDTPTSATQTQLHSSDSAVEAPTASPHSAEKRRIMQSTHRSDTSSARPSPSQSAIVTRSVSAHPTTNPRLQDESTASGRAQHAPHSNRQSECSSSSAVSENGRISDLLFGCVTDLGPDPLHTLQQPLSARRNLASATALLAFPQLRKEEKDEGSLRDDGLDASDDVIEPDTQSTAAYGKVRGVASNRSASKAEVEDSAAHSVLEHEQASSPVLESTQPFLSPKIEVNAQELGKKAAKDTTSLDLRSESVPGDAVPAGGEDIFQMGMSAESRSLNRSMSATASSTDLPLATSAKASDRTLIETLPTWRQDARCAKQASTATLKTDNLIDVGFSEAVKEPRQAPSFTAVLSDPDLPELGTDTKLANIDCLQLTADCKTEFVRPVKAARHGVESDRGKDIASHAGTEISSGQRIKHEAAKRTQKAVVPPGRILLPDFKNNTSAERRTSSPHNPAPPGLVKERLRVNLPQAEYSSSFRADLIGLASHSDSRQRVKAFLDKLEQADDLVAEEHVVRRMQLRDLSADASAEVQQLFRPRMTLKELHTGTQVQRAQLKTGRLQMQQPFDEAVSSSQHSGSVPRRKNTPHWTTQNIAAAPEKKRAMPLPISGISPKSVGPDVLHRLQQSEPTAADEVQSRRNGRARSKTITADPLREATRSAPSLTGRSRSGTERWDDVHSQRQLLVSASPAQSSKSSKRPLGSLSEVAERFSPDRTRSIPIPSLSSETVSGSVAESKRFQRHLPNGNIEKDERHSTTLKPKRLLRPLQLSLSQEPSSSHRVETCSEAIGSPLMCYPSHLSTPASPNKGQARGSESSGCRSPGREQLKQAQTPSKVRAFNSNFLSVPDHWSDIYDLDSLDRYAELEEMESLQDEPLQGDAQTTEMSSDFGGWSLQESQAIPVDSPATSTGIFSPHDSRTASKYIHSVPNTDHRQESRSSIFSRSPPSVTESAPALEISFELRHPTVSKTAQDGNLLEFGLRVYVTPTARSPERNVGSSPGASVNFSCPLSLHSNETSTSTSFSGRRTSGRPSSNRKLMLDERYEYSTLSASEMRKIQNEAQETIRQRIVTPRSPNFDMVEHAASQQIGGDKALRSPFRQLTASIHTSSTIRPLLLCDPDLQTSRPSSPRTPSGMHSVRLNKPLPSPIPYIHRAPIRAATPSPQMAPGQGRKGRRSSPISTY